MLRKLQPLVDAHPEVAPNWQSLRDVPLGQLQQAFFLYKRRLRSDCDLRLGRGDDALPPQARSGADFVTDT